MGILKRLFPGAGKVDRLPPVIAQQCPRCGFWTESFRYFWLPREIADRIGRTGSPEESRRKWKAYGKLWTDGEYAVDLGGGRMMVVPAQTGGDYDQFAVPESPECPVCGTPYSSDWPKAYVVCKKCGRNVFLDKGNLSVLCPACGRIHHTRDVTLKAVR